MFNELITIENLFNAWYEFKKGKSNKPDVVLFERNLEDNIFQLYQELSTKTYSHQPYHTFHIWDPKFRIISKASVRDRVVHHLLYRYLEKIFQPTFIHQSYSCQIGKGIHLAVNDLDNALYQSSKKYTQSVWYLKLDIKKFFANVDHEVLLGQIKNKIYDADILWLLEKIIYSYSSPGQLGRGVPIGNLTSQIFANIYLNELDYFAKFKLKQKYYFRYADDFIFLHEDKNYLEKLKNIICQFVEEKLHLTIHPNKIFLQKFSQGLDFLGYVLLPYHRVLRTKTKKRMFKKANEENLQSYLGLLTHCQGYNLETKLKNEIWLNKKSKQFFEVNF